MAFQVSLGILQAHFIGRIAADTPLLPLDELLKKNPAARASCLRLAPGPNEFEQPPFSGTTRRAGPSFVAKCVLICSLWRWGGGEK